MDAVLPHLHPGSPHTEAEGVSTHWHRTTLLVTAITVHNIPEGLAVGVAFGAVGAGLELNGAITLSGALALAVGIAIQNFPEGVAVAMPIRAMGVSRLRSFWFGQLSAVVEPIAAVIGAAAVLAFRPMLPYALAFAAGAMIYVVIEELIPESQRNDNEDVATVATLFGFMVMMILDVALG
jgi:ZIP family zinc transporter